MKKVDKGDRGVAGGELEDGPRYNTNTNTITNTNTNTNTNTMKKLNKGTAGWPAANGKMVPAESRTSRETSDGW